MSGETIKGISVLIEGNTTGLQKALGDVNKESKNIQTELKAVEKLLKLDPGNTELLAQKQKLLGDAVSTTEEKLTRLKAAQQQVNEQFARGDISEGQYRAFQREVAAAEQQLQGFENQLNDTGDASRNLGQNLEAAGDKMKSAGEKMSVGITAPIVAAGGVMLKGAVDAEAAQGKLQAQLGITSEEADKLGKTAKEVWKTGFGENIEAASEAVKNVKLNMGDLANNELQSVATGALALSDIFEADVKESTAAAGVMMKSFGVSGQEAMDIITTGFQKGGDYSGELIDTLREYSPQFAAMGMSADQMLGILIAGTKAGAWNMDKVGDAMKEFNIRAQDGSKTTADGFAAIGLNAQQMGAAIAEGGEKGKQAFTATITALAAMKDPVAQNAAGVALFGTQWEDVRSKVIVAMAEGVKGVGDFKGATAQATEDVKNNNPGMALTTAMRELQGAVGPALLPIADIITNSIVPAIKSMAKWFADLSPAGQGVVLAITGIAVAIGPMLIAVGSVITKLAALDLSFIKTAAKSVASAATTVASWVSMGAAAVVEGTKVVASWILMGAQSLLNAAKMAAAWVIAMGPIALVIAAIVGLVAVVITNWDTISAKTIEVWNSITAFLSGVWDTIKSAVVGTWDEIKKKTIEIWDSIKTALEGWWQNLTGWVSSWDIWQYAKNAWETLKTKTVQVWDALKSSLESWWITLTTWLGTWNPWSVVSTLWGTWKQNTIGIWQDLKREAVTWGHNIIQGMADGITSRLSAARNAVAGVAEAIKDKVKSILGIHSPSTVMHGYGENISEGLANGINAKGSLIASEMETVVSGVKTKVGEAIGELNHLRTEAAKPITYSVRDIPPGDNPAYTDAYNRTAALYDQTRPKLVGPEAQARVTAIKAEVTTLYNTLRDQYSSDTEFVAAFSKAADPLFVELESIQPSNPNNWHKRVYLDANGKERVEFFGDGGIVFGPTKAIVGEKAPEAILPLPALQPMMNNALLGAISVLGGSSVSNVSSKQLILQVINKGTIVGRNGMDEFAKTVSKQISRDFGLSTGGAW